MLHFVAASNLSPSALISMDVTSAALPVNVLTHNPL